MDNRADGLPRFGHFHTWLVDQLQRLLEENHGEPLFPNWVGATENRDCDCNFEAMAIHSGSLAPSY